MKFYEPISKDSIIDEINQLCGVTNEVYLNIDKIRRIHQALDRYWFLAVNSASKGSFDDTNRTALPVETQNIVEGTNYYKMGSFTNNVLQILKLSVLNDSGDEFDLVREDFDDINDFYETYTTDEDSRGLPQWWTKMGDYIYLRPCPDYSESNGLRAYVNRELSKLTFETFTITIASPGVITDTAHGLSNSDGVLLFTDGALPTGLTADTTIYYVSDKADDTFKLATTPSSVGSTEVNTSGTQSGTHKYIKVSGEPGIPVIHHPYLAKYAALAEMKPTHPNYGRTAQEIAILEQDIMDYWRTMEGEDNVIIKPFMRSGK